MRVYPELSQDEEFETLRAAGYTGSLNDKQYKYLRDQGLSGTLNDMFLIYNNLSSDTTAPTITSYSPADNATDVAIDTDLSIVFSETMDTTASTTVTLKAVGGATIETFDSSTDGVWSTTTNTNDTWTVTPTSSFTNSESLAVQYSGFADVAGNIVSAVGDDTSWNFDVIAPAGALYWRIRIDETVTNSQAYTRIGEIELRSTPGGADETSPLESATRATSSGDFGSGYEVQNAFADDGVSSLWYSSHVSQPGIWWVQWEFESEILINEVRLIVTDSTVAVTPVAVTIQSSNDGVTFTDEFSDASLTYSSNIATITRP